MKQKPTLDELIELFKGKGGNPESETIVVDNNTDKKEGFVTLFSNKSDVSKIIERTRNAIIDYEVIGDGVQFKIDRRAFRSGIHAFRNI